MSSTSNNSQNMDDLIGSASQKLGTSPEELQKQIDEGKLDNIMKKLPPKQAANLQNILDNPEMAKKMMETPQAQMMMKRFFKQK